MDSPVRASSGWPTCPAPFLRCERQTPIGASTSAAYRGRNIEIAGIVGNFCAGPPARQHSTRRPASSAGPGTAAVDSSHPARRHSLRLYRNRRNIRMTETVVGYQCRVQSPRQLIRARRPGWVCRTDTTIPPLKTGCHDAGRHWQAQVFWRLRRSKKDCLFPRRGPRSEQERHFCSARCRRPI